MERLILGRQKDKSQRVFGIFVIMYNSFPRVLSA